MPKSIVRSRAGKGGSADGAGEGRGVGTAGVSVRRTVASGTRNAGLGEETWLAPGAVPVRWAATSGVDAAAVGEAARPTPGTPVARPHAESAKSSRRPVSHAQRKAACLDIVNLQTNADSGGYRCSAPVYH